MLDICTNLNAPVVSLETTTAIEPTILAILVILLVVIEASMEQAVCYNYQPAGQKSFSVEIIDKIKNPSENEEVNKRVERIKYNKKQRLKQAYREKRERERGRMKS